MKQRNEIEQILEENFSKEIQEDISDITIVKTFYEIMLDLRDLQQETSELLSELLRVTKRQV